MKTKAIIFATLLLISSINAQNGGTALNLAGSGSVFCTTQNSYWTTATTDVTIEAWISWNGTIANQIIIANGDTGQDGYFVYLDTNGDIVCANSGVGGYTFGNSDLVANKWYHIAAVLTSTTGEWLLYINNKAQTATSSNSSINAPGSQSSVGRSVIGANNLGGEAFNGIIDEVRIWGISRAADSLGTYMFKELEGTETDLIAYYKLNDAGGLTAIDSEDSGSFDGTLQSSAAWVTSGAFSVSNKSLTGTALGHPFTSVNAQFSITCWLKINSYRQRSLYDVTSSLGSDVISIIWLAIGANQYNTSTSNENKTAVFGFEEKFLGSGGFNQVRTATEIPLDEWVHLAGTFDGTDLRIYINGIEDATSPGSKDFSFHGAIGNQPPLLASGFPVPVAFDGYLDELSVWEKALSQNEIIDLMYENLTGSESDLYDYFRFDEEGDRFYDLATSWSSSNADSTSTGIPFNTWIGGISNDWNDPQNWSTGSAASSNQNVVITNYTLSNAPSISGSPVLNSLFVKSGAAPTLMSDITINGNLTLTDNDLNLNGNTITLGSDAKLIEKDGVTVVGSSGLITTTRTLNSPSGENIAGLGVQITSSSNFGSTVITRTHNEHTANSNKSILRSFEINPTTNTGLNATLVFHYDDSELNGLNESDLVLFKSTDGGNTWTNEGGTVNTTENTVELSGIDGFSLWTLAENSNPLPVELTYFEGTATEDGVLLEWETATEINNYGFDVERSTPLVSDIPPFKGGKEGRSWEKIGFVQGNGTTNSPKNYEFTDSELPNSESVDYRLKQIDNDGTFAYSKVITVDLTNITSVDDEIEYEFALQQNYPNPFNPTTTIEFTIPSNMKSEAVNTKLIVFNTLGQVVSTLIDEQLPAGNHKVMFDGENFASGVYLYKLSYGEFVSTKKLIIVK